MESEEIKTQDIVESSHETMEQLKAEIAALRHTNDALRNALKDAEKKWRQCTNFPLFPLSAQKCLSMRIINIIHRIFYKNLACQKSNT